MGIFDDLLTENLSDKQALAKLLSLSEPDRQQALFDKALSVKAATVGRFVYLRGLIELSNVCSKNCYYCGIRAGNPQVERYTLSEEEVLNAAVFAHQNRFGSLVIQTGEQTGPAFAAFIVDILEKIHAITNNELTITLSCGEQPLKVYELWKRAGAERYLLRIETSNKDLYYTIHPRDRHHSFEARLDALKYLREAGYQVGTGVMIGLPGQQADDLAEDLLFFKSMDIDMVGMGPYIEHAATPLFAKRHMLMPASERFNMSLRMIALLRILMPYINIAASTALETINPLGRQMGVLAGANVVMPNLTPVSDRKKYLLYNNKPNLDKDASLSTKSLNAAISAIGETICFDMPGDSIHFQHRTSPEPGNSLS